MTEENPRTRKEIAFTYGVAEAAMVGRGFVAHILARVNRVLKYDRYGSLPSDKLLHFSNRVKICLRQELRKGQCENYIKPDRRCPRTHGGHGQRHYDPEWHHPTAQPITSVWRRIGQLKLTTSKEKNDQMLMRYIQEADRCILLCKSCHRKIHKYGQYASSDVERCV